MPQERHGVTYYSVTELAKKLDVHRNSVIYWIKSGKIKAVRLGLAEKSPYQIEEREAARVMAELS
ncbi:MAG: helix-turn-helix domain-containing protein [Chloroflexi bacterium]|nr:helix-turn-helix domain-containing protein [Chloroflexota bacterium]